MRRVITNATIIIPTTSIPHSQTNLLTIFHLERTNFEEAKINKKSVK